MQGESSDQHGPTQPVRVLVLVEDGPNRRLLTEWAREEGHVPVTVDGTTPDGVDTDGGTDTGAVDACIADVGGLKAHADLILEHRQEALPSYLPCLLVVPDRQQVPTRERLPVEVDAVVSVPIRKQDLARQFRTLVRARTYSVKLKERKEQYQQLLGMAPEGIFLLQDEEIVFLNDVAGSMLTGERVPDRQQFENTPFLDIVVPEDRPAVRSRLETLSAGEAVSTFADVRLESADGSAIDAEYAGVQVPYQGGIATQLIVRDLTEKRRQEQRLRLYGRALEEASVGVTIADVTQPDEPLVYANDALEEITGYPIPEVLGRNCRFLQGEGTDPGKVAEIRRALEAEESTTVTLLNYRKDDTPFWNELELAPVPNRDGEVTHFLGFQRDVSDRVERERQLEALQIATRDLMGATSREEIAQIAVRTADEVLELPATGVFYARENALEPAYASERSKELLGDIPTFHEGDGIVWEAYRDQEVRCVDDVPEHPDVYNPETPIRSELFVPLGEHGVLVSGSTTPGAFADTDVRFSEMLATSVEAALDRQDREREARRARARVEEILERVEEAFFSLDRDWELTYVNDTAAQLLGRDQGEIVGRSVWAEFPEAKGTTFEQKYREAIESQEPVRFEEYYPPLETWFRVSVYPDENGLSVFFRDVTDRKEREQELLRYETMIQTMDDGVYVLDAENCFTFVNDALLEMTGYEPEDVIGKHASVLSSESITERADRVQADMDEDDVGIVETTVHTKDGEAIPVENRIVPFPPDAESEQGRIGIVRDITQRKEREEELLRYETMVRAAQSPIYTADTDGNFVNVNRALAELTGYDVDQLAGEYVSVILDDADIEHVEDMIREYLAGERDGDLTTEIEVETTDGTTRRCLLTIGILPFEEEFRGTVGILRDITKRHRREQHLEVMDRVLRHNLRNEMNVVRGRAEALEKTVNGDSLEHVEEIRRSANALLSLSEGARRFHDAFHNQEAAVDDVDLVDEVEAVVERLRESYPHARIRTDFPEAARALAHDAIRIPIEELVENAIVHNDAKHPGVGVSVTLEAETIEIVVEDEGPGLPENERKTLEGDVESALEHASGLGLWLVSWIVDSSGGEITCSSSEDGTTVRVCLPRPQA